MPTLSSAARKLNLPGTRFAIAGGLALISLAYLAYWAGVPQRGLPAFAIGASLILAFSIGLGWLAWRILLHPHPAPQAVSENPLLTIDARRLAATLLALGALSLTVGGFWDEVWHRKFGLPFGSDLLWRPHWLIYFGLLVPPLLAASAFLLLLRRRDGRWLHHLRAERGLGWLVFLGAFLVVSVPADPVWHIIYGSDISPWSLPHLVLMVSALALALLGASFQLSSSAGEVRWASILSLHPPAAFSLVFHICAASFTAQVLLGDFAAGNANLLLRPDWLLPVLLTALAVLIGTLANHSTRSAGGATAVGLGMLALRGALVWAFDFPRIGPSTWLPLLPILVAVDLLYAYRTLRRRSPPSAAAIGTGVLPGVAVSILMIPPFIGPFAFRADSLGLTLLLCWLAAGATGWIGIMLGDGIAGPGPDAAALRTASRWVAWAAPALFSAAVLLFIFLVATAAPPTQVY